MSISYKINISSITGIIINQGISVGPYATAKAGVIMSTKLFARDWAVYNIRVNSIAPGYINTPLFHAGTSDIAPPGHPVYNRAEWLKKELERIPMGRIGEPSEIGAAAVFLASNASSYITGHTLIVDGGYTIL